MITFRSALVYSFLTRYAALILQFLATVILARLLSPTEIGIFSVGTAVIMIAHTLRDFGTSNYIIQEKELTDARLRTAFTLTVIVAWSLAGMLWSAAMPLATFYREPGVTSVLRVMAINFLLIPLGSITLALMRREMNFRALMFINLASTLVQSGLSVLLAALGAGFISLAWGGIGSTVATVIGALMVNRAWVVARPSLSEHKQVLNFSLRSTLSSIAAEAGHASPDLVIGRTLGMEANGLFARALGYVLLFERLLQDILRGVMLTYLAGEVRAGVDLRAKLFLALEHIGAVAWFMIGLLAILADPMIRLLFGPQWIEAAPVAQILCLAMAIRCFAPTLSSALVANGQIALVMRVSVWSTLGKFLLLIGLSPFGLTMAALGFTLAEMAGLVWLIRTTQYVGLFHWADYRRLCAQTLPFTLVGLAPAMVILFVWAPPTTSIQLMVWLMVAGGSSGLVWLSVLWIWNQPPKQEIQRAAHSLVAGVKAWGKAIAARRMP